MKKILRWLLLSGVMMTLLCVSALAAEPTEAGMYKITGSGATLTPQTANESSISKDDSNAAYSGYYANAARFGVSATATSGKQYLLLVVKGKNGTAPTAENIVYIDQAAADSSGAVTFTAYPSTLGKGHYCVYVVGHNKGYEADSPAAEFDTYQPYTLGDVNGDGKVKANDAQFALQMSVNLGTWTDTQKLAADVNKDGKVKTNDALFILQKAVGLSTVF